MKRIRLKNFLTLMLDNVKVMIIEQHNRGKNKILAEDKTVEEMLKEDSILKRYVSAFLVNENQLIQHGKNRIWIYVFPEGIKTPKDLLKEDMQKAQNKEFSLDN